jgi:hypothetical protein
LKKVLLYVILVAVVLQGVNRWAVYIQFQLNKEFIAKNLCVKKAIKNNCCQGSCQLSKRLGEEKNPKNNSSQTQPKEEQEQILYLQNILPFLKVIATDDQINHSFHYSISFTEVEIKPLFHPPALIS